MFWGELKRRNVVKVGLAYVVVGWLVIQMVTTVLPTFNAPSWIAQSITFILILGLPFVLLFAWAFEITPEGLRKTRDVPAVDSITPLTSQRLNYVITGLLIVAVAFMAVDNYLLDDAAEPDEAQAASTAAPAEPAVEDQPAPIAEPQTVPNSVAVIPFTNSSPREDDAYFAAGIHEEILNQLVKLSGLNVIARTSVMQYTGTSKTIPEIGRELNVENVMEGSVRYADGRVLVTTQLIDAKTGLHVWSESYERDFENIFAIQADIAMNVANALETAFTPAEQENIERLPTDSLEAYELFLAAQEGFRSATGGVWGSSLQAIDAALALDPEFARAWALKADIHGMRAQGASGTSTPPSKTRCSPPHLGPWSSSRIRSMRRSSWRPRGADKPNGGRPSRHIVELTRPSQTPRPRVTARICSASVISARPKRSLRSRARRIRSIAPFAGSTFSAWLSRRSGARGSGV